MPSRNMTLSQFVKQADVVTKELVRKHMDKKKKISAPQPRGVSGREASGQSRPHRIPTGT